MVACWRLRVMRDPWLALGRMLQGEGEDEAQRWDSDEDDDGSAEDSDSE